MLRTSGQALRCKLRVAVLPSETEKRSPFKASAAEAVLAMATQQFVVLVSPYDTVRDLRSTISTTFSKLYQNEVQPHFKHLKDASGFDVDDDFMVGEIFESNDLVQVVPSGNASGLVTPESSSVTPVFRHAEIICPAPKSRKLDPEELLQNPVQAAAETPAPPQEIIEAQESSSDSASCSSASEEEVEETKLLEPIEEESSDSDSSEEETEPEKHELVLTSSRASSQPIKLETLDDQIAAAVCGSSDDSESELEVKVLSDSSEEEESESEDEQPLSSRLSTISSPQIQLPKIQTPESSSSDSEDSSAAESSEEESESDEGTQLPEPVKNILPAKVVSSSASESSSDDSSSASESEDDDEADLNEAIKSISSSSASESSEESDSGDELNVPAVPVLAADVKKVLKGVPKYTSLTSLNDCLSQAVSGRATPLVQKAATESKPAATKGRVRLPKKKPSASGYDASLFA